VASSASGKAVRQGSNALPADGEVLRPMRSCPSVTVLVVRSASKIALAAAVLYTPAVRLRALHV